MKKLLSNIPTLSTNRQIAYSERALAEAELRAQALEVTDLISANPLKAASLAIQITSISNQKLQGRLISPIQGGLRNVIDRVQEFQRYEGHKGTVHSIAISPDGNTIVSGGQDCTLQYWDRQGNSIGKISQGHEGRISSVAFSPSGQMIASGGEDCTLRLWDLNQNSIGQASTGHKGYISSITFSPKSKTLISGSADRTLRLWDCYGNPIGSPFQGHEDYVTSVAFSPVKSRI